MFHSSMQKQTNAQDKHICRTCAGVSGTPYLGFHPLHTKVALDARSGFRGSTSEFP